VANGYAIAVGSSGGYSLPAGVNACSILSGPEFGISNGLRLPARIAGGWTDALHEPPKVSTILLVDDLADNQQTLRALFEGEAYRILTAVRADEALEKLDREPIDLVILDMFLPDMDGTECCRRIRKNRRTELVPILMLSCSQAAEDEIAGVGSGADGFLGRPYHPEVLRTRVRSMLRHKATVDRLEESETILLAMARAVEQRDNNTAGHCERLAALSVAMGMAMELPSHHLLALHRGGYLHDIGKIGMPDALLFKKGPLSEAEWRTMRTHTLTGEEICRPMKCLAPVLPIIRSHHERWDGTGYPDGISGHSIPLLARVLQMADIYDALTADRPYKAAMSSGDALRTMQEETDRGWHDPELMRLFRRLRHAELQQAVANSSDQWQDAEVMRQSLENLNSSLGRA
jgi:putative two-component system response regulator